MSQLDTEDGSGVLIHNVRNKKPGCMTCHNPEGNELCSNPEKPQILNHHSIQISSLVPVLRQISPALFRLLYSFDIHFNIIFRLLSSLFPKGHQIKTIYAQPLITTSNVLHGPATPTPVVSDWFILLVFRVKYKF